MCLAIPARIRSISGNHAEAEIEGVVRRISLALTPEARVGDYVLLHTGYAIAIVDEAEAEETLRLLREISKTDGTSTEPSVGQPRDEIRD
ncbi:MAG: HypC/HybG/HupF family hydrogenase formation chaperone [Dehalococcoidales bacterium]|nr:HypC/HybG/HupF family hydrogenase formation chaperone [Dehalococcoidales bacterium]